MNFAHTSILWLLLVLPTLLVAFYWWSGRERRRLMTLFIEARLLPGLISGVSMARQRWRQALVVLAVTAVILVLARPQWGFTWEESKQKGLDIMVAIDTSKSMLAEDIAPNRLGRAKLAALDLMQQSKSDRLGLVAFAGGAFLQCPLTIDDSAFRQSVEALDVNIIPQGGTALAEAIKTANEAYKEGDNFKILVIFTDGEDNDENALAAAEAAAKDGMKIFTIGIGTAEGEILRLKDAKGRTDYIRDAEGNVVKSRLNEALLQQIAGATEGGFYLPLRGAKTIDTLYEKGLAPLPKSEGQEKLVKRYHEQYHWPLALAALLLLAEMLWPEQRREKSTVGDQISDESVVSEASRQASGSQTTAAIRTFAVGLMGIIWMGTGVGMASPGNGLRQYKSGNYADSLKEFERELEKKKDDLRLQYNAGAAAYRDQKYERAVEHFGAAAAAPDLKLQEWAYYNLGNAMYRLGAAWTEPKKQIEAWEGAVKQFEIAMKLNTNNVDALFNYEFVKKKLEELKQQQQQNNQDNIQPSEEAKKAKAEADVAVQRREYGRALDIMQNQLKRDATTRYYNDYIERLKEVNGVKEAPVP